MYFEVVFIKNISECVFLYLDKTESDVIFSDFLVRFAEEGRRWDAQEVPLAQPLHEAVVTQLVRLRT